MQKQEFLDIPEVQCLKQSCDTFHAHCWDQEGESLLEGRQKNQIKNSKVLKTATYLRLQKIIDSLISFRCDKN